MRLLVRPNDARFCGSPHALRSAYNHFTLVEPFPNGNLYFKRVVDRPVCVYVVADQLFILSSELSAHSLTPIGGGRFHLQRDGRFFSLGDYLDDDTCVPTGEWTEGKAWEAFRLVAPPPLDERERSMIGRIDATFGRRVDAAPVSDEIEAEVRAYLTSIAVSSAKLGARVAPARRACGTEREIGWGFRGSVDVSRRSCAAGWAARHREPTSVSVFVNGVRVGEAACVGERPDVMAAGFALTSGWSFEFAPPLEAADRVAFRFPDGSPLRQAADAQEPVLVAPTIEEKAILSSDAPPPPAAGSGDDYEGHVDICGAAQAVGWAASGLEPAVVEVFVNEARIGEIHPATERPDVADAGYALLSGWSFQFAPPLGADDRVAFRFKDGSPLRQAECEPPPVAPTIEETSHVSLDVSPPPAAGWGDGREGCVDVCDAVHATGWAARGLEPAVVEVFVNEARIGEIHPATERPDVGDAGYALLSGWSFQFAPPLGADDRVAFRFKDGSPLRQAECEQAPFLVAAIVEPASHPTVSDAPSAPAVSSDRYEGSVDFCNASHAAGWAARSLEPATVHVYINGARTGEAHPDGERPDVAAAGYALRCAWSFEFRRPLEIEDRVAFHFADGSALPFAAGGDHCGWQTDSCAGAVETSRAS